jgi:hypothetical protein
MPIACQRPGYVGVGVSLSREGEIRSHWIARSTYGAECPVDQCLSDVVSTWFFEPLPESMKVILPVQVLRTDRPLPYGPARAAADAERSTAAAAADAERKAAETEHKAAAEAESGSDAGSGRRMPGRLLARNQPLAAGPVRSGRN